MFKALSNTIESLNSKTISSERKEVLQLLIDFIKQKQANNQISNLNFICTHNSRRSHLSQIWAQTMANYYKVPNVIAYSGGTEKTAVFPKVIETLIKQGFEIQKLTETSNPVYAIKYSENELPIIGYSKTFDDKFNPVSHFAAVMTCSSADEGCPFITGAEKRFPIRYEDPKQFDGTDVMDEKYMQRSIEIATEMAYVFSNIEIN